MITSYSHDGNTDEPEDDSRNVINKKYEYRIAYSSANRPGTALQIFHIMEARGLEIRRMFIGSTELQASQEYFGKRGAFKVSSRVELSYQEQRDLADEIQNAIFNHCKKYFPGETGPEHVEKPTISQINITERVHFSAQFICVDKPGAASSVLANIRNTKVFGCDLGLISFILIPCYERFSTDGDVSFIDVRGFIDNRYIYETLSPDGHTKAAEILCKELHNRFSDDNANSNIFYKWSIKSTHPVGPSAMGGENCVEECVKQVPSKNFRVEYYLPNVPGTALAVAQSLRGLSYNIRRAFIGEINVATHSPGSRPSARARFNVTSTFSEVSEEKLRVTVKDAITQHLASTFSINEQLVKSLRVVVKEADHNDKFYFGVQVRLSYRERNDQSVSARRFLKQIATIFFETDSLGKESVVSWDSYFSSSAVVKKPRINIDRLALLTDYTGVLHPNASHEGDILVDLHLSVDDYWDRDIRFRNEFAESFVRWLYNSIGSIDKDEVVRFIGIKSLSPALIEIYSGPDYPLDHS